MVLDSGALSTTERGWLVWLWHSPASLLQLILVVVRRRTRAVDATVVILDWDSLSFVVVVVVVVLWVHCWLVVRRLLLWSVVVQELWQPLSVDMIVSPWSAN